MPRDDRRTEAGPEEMTAPLHALLEGVVDYAGLFPPAGLDMRAAVTNYASYLASDDAWMLGRFVLPLARLDEFEGERLAMEGEHGARRWRLSGLTGGDVMSDVALATEFNSRGGTGAIVDSLEAKLATVEEVRRLASRLPGDMELYVEIPVADDPAPLVRAIADVGAKAKIRTGGVTPAAFPPSAQIIRFMRRCIEAGTAFKATAGLHHPLRAQYRLTYEPDAPSGTMFGFLNVFLAASLLCAGGSDEDAVALLEETSANDLEFSGAEARWRSHRLTTDQLRDARRALARSFGSCSFREPVDDLHALSLL
jgi:hypothetical protein